MSRGTNCANTNHRRYRCMESPIEERFWAKVRIEGECYIWKGAANDRGYGQIWNGVRVVYAHRWIYELLIGPIPEGLQLDHLCRNPRCVRVSHLEPVTQAENMRRSHGVSAQYARRSHCKNGHRLVEGNLMHVATRPHARICRSCKVASDARARAARRAACG